MDAMVHKLGVPLVAYSLLWSYGLPLLVVPYLVAVKVGNNEDSVAAVGSANISRLKRERYRRIAALPQAAANSVNPSRGIAPCVFDHNPGWL